jgi:hypothetical protein
MCGGRPRRQSTTFLHLCNFLNVSFTPGRISEAHDEKFWNSLLSLALEHFVAPLLFERLQQRGVLDEVPKEQRTFLSLCYKLNQARNRKLRIQLLELADVFGREGVTTVILKSGAHLFEADNNPEPASWMMNDLDVLVDAPERAVEVALGLGYTIMEDLPWGHAIALRHSDHVGIIELHRDLGPQRNFLNAAEAMGSAEPITAKAPLHKLSATHRALHNIYHAQIQDRRFELASPSLQQLSIFSALVERHKSEIDWAAVNHRFKRLGYERALSTYLFQSCSLLGCSVPLLLSQCNQWRSEMHMRRVYYQMDHRWTQSVLSLWAVLTSNMTRDRVQYRVGEDATALGRSLGRASILTGTVRQYGFGIFDKIAKSRRKRFLT